LLFLQGFYSVSHPKRVNMNVTMAPVASLRPYARNARRNDGAVDAVAASIREFGFRQPIVVAGSDREVVVGHTRLKAAIKLGLNEVPVVDASDLTEAQRRAYRLVDNKTAELAEWDLDLLGEELYEVSDVVAFDVEDFGFTFDVDSHTGGGKSADEDDGENERLRTDHAYNLDKVNMAHCSGGWEIPTIERNDHIPDDLLSFNYAKTSSEHTSGIHFFIDDYQFERVWNDPDTYVEVLRPFDCVLSPDFSLYMDMPLPMKLWNVYRSRACGNYWQRQGIKVIPTLSWAGPETFKFCFEGIPQGSIVAVSTVGVKNNRGALDVWGAGMKEAIRRIKPSTVLLYGGDTGFDFKDIPVREFKNRVTERMKRG
jgi:hypothetical protein